MQFLQAGAAAVSLLSTLALAEDPTGRDRYLQVCNICHQERGQGVEGAFPPLDNRLAAWASSKEGRRYLVSVLKNGLFGAIDVNGVRYVGAMPPMTQLGPDDMGAVLNYVLGEFAAAGPEQAFSTAEVEAFLAEAGQASSRALRPDT